MLLFLAFYNFVLVLIFLCLSFFQEESTGNEILEPKEHEEFKDLTLKEKSMTTSGYEADGEEGIADDCFHMVTQYNWEEDIIWNGDDIKHKVKYMK